MSNRDAYIKKMKTKLDEWNADIVKIEARVESTEANMKINYNQKIVGFAKSCESRPFSCISA